jgi:hypothetical protein
MNRTVVNSAAVASVGYDPQACILEVRFRAGGVYQYFDVPESVHEQLMAVDSMAAFLNTVVKPHYRCVRIARGSGRLSAA